MPDMNDEIVLKQLAEKLKRTEEALELTELFIKHSPAMIWRADSTGRYLQVNDELCRTLGYTREELLSLHVYDINAQMTPKMWATLWEHAVFGEGVRFEGKMRTRDKRILPVEVQAVRVNWNNQSYSIGIGWKLEERKRGKIDTLEMALSRQKALLNNLPYIAWMKDADSRYIAVNDKFAEFCGRSPEEVIGLTDFDLWPQTLAEKYVADDMAMMESGKSVHAETILEDRQGHCFWSDIFKTPIYDASSHDAASKLHAGTVGIAQDISARKAAEEALRKMQQELERTNAQLKHELQERMRLESELVQAQKMQSVGHLAAGVAHEINNPLAFVRSNLNTLADYAQSLRTLLGMYQALQQQHSAALLQIAPDLMNNIRAYEKQEDLALILEDIAPLCEESKDGLNRIKDIVQELKTFARPEEPDRQETNINECLESTLKIIWNELKHKCAVEKQFQELPLLNCHPGQLNQVFLNLLSNAAQAIKEQGKIMIQTAVRDEHIVVAISDTGEGIAPENLENIFNPFFTTKPVGEGTGLGLSISYGIIQKHHGAIEVDSTPGKGSTFTIRLPLHPFQS